MSFTAEEKLMEVLREIKMREKLYPGRIEIGLLSPTLAAKQIAIMREIANDLEEIAKKERLL